MSEPKPLDDMQALLSISEGFLDLHEMVASAPPGDHPLVAIDAETELWDNPEISRGGMMWAAGGPRELAEKLAVMSRRPELTDRQRAIVSILQGRLKKMLANGLEE